MLSDTATTAATTAAPDPRVLSLSKVPDELLPAFSPIERSIILTCKIVTGERTLEQTKEMLNGSKQGSH